MELNYKVYGDGFPVIILHGLLGSLDNWQTIARQLGKSYKVFTLDLRNHGRSPHSPVHDLPSITGDIIEFMDRQGIVKSHFIGHSMGGKAAMWLALQHPDRVEKLVVVDIGVKAYPPWHDSIFQALSKLKPESAQSRNEIDEQLTRDIEDQAVRLFLLKNLERLPEGGYRWKFNLPALYKNYRNITGAIQSSGRFDGDVLFIKGGNSPYIEPGDLPEIKRYFPNAKLIEIPGAGHWVHAEAPVPFLQAVTGFLSSMERK